MKTLATVLILSSAVVSWAQDRPEPLSMQQAVDFALKHSPTLRGAQAEVDAARAERGAARGRQAPQLSLNGFASRSNMPGILSSPMGSEPQALVLSPEDNFADGNLTLMAPLYTGGFLSGLVSAAAAKEQAAIAEASAMRAEVVLMVREAYTRALYGVELVAAQDSRVAAAEAMVRDAKSRLEAGSGIEAAVRRAEAELAEAKQERTMAENDRQKMLLELLAEMGAPMDKPVTLAETISFEPPSRTLEQSLAAAATTRGELLAAEHRAKAAQRLVGSAEGSLRPQVYGFAMGDAFTPRDGMGRGAGYTFGLSVSLPLFDGGMRKSEVSAARAMAARATAEADAWKLRVEKEVRQAWLDIETAAQNYETARAALEGARSAYDVVAIRVETGKSILVEQLDALATLTRARANVAQALFDHRLAVARLDRAIGLADPVSLENKPK